MTILVTGGAGFIGSNFVLDWIAAEGEPVVNLDKLTYAGNLANLAALAGDKRHVFVRGDICDAAFLARLFAEHKPRAVVHFAAESHVDRSIAGPDDFINTNCFGTNILMDTARRLEIEQVAAGFARRIRAVRVQRRFFGEQTCRPERAVHLIG